MKIKLIIYSEMDMKDEFIFNSLEEYFDFMNNLTVEKLMDRYEANFNYSVIMEE